MAANLDVCIAGPVPMRQSVQDKLADGIPGIKTFQRSAETTNKDLCRWTDARLRGFIIRNPIMHILDTPERVFFWEDEVFGIDSYCFTKLDAETRAVDFKCNILRRLEYYFWMKYRIRLAGNEE